MISRIRKKRLTIIVVVCLSCELRVQSSNASNRVDSASDSERIVQEYGSFGVEILEVDTGVRVLEYECYALAEDRAVK